MISIRPDEISNIIRQQIEHYTKMLKPLTSVLYSKSVTVTPAFTA